MGDIRNLADTPLETLCAAFNDAFSNYEVRTALTVERLAEMLTTRSYVAGASLGYFLPDGLAAFALTGLRTIDGEAVGYDVATGVVQAHQKEGLGGLLAKALIDKGRELGLRRFLLEVLVNNAPAQKIYEKSGFRVTRRFGCYDLPRVDVAAGPPPPGEVDALPLPEATLDERFYNSFQPSWQNALESYRNARDRHAVRTLWRDGRLLAYGIIQEARGSVIQLGLAPEVRHEAGFRAMVALLAERTAADRLFFANLESGSDMDRLAKASGLNPVVDQFEMAYEFAGS
jgi:ribosomal protein S18 acetylase RimI-like enzyme